MSGVSPFEDGFKIKILNEALKGQRPVNDIAAEGGIAGTTLRTWLEEHYAEFPEDERRHLQLRVPKSENPPAADTEDDEARDDMTRPGETPANKVDPKTRESVMARVRASEAAREAGEPYEKKREIAEEFGISPGTISYWLREEDPERAVKKPADPRRAAVFADIREGLSRADIMKKHEIGPSTWHRWKTQWDEMKAARRDQMAAARAVKAKMLKTDPEFRARVSESLKASKAKRRTERRTESESQLAFEETQMSRPEPPQSQSYPPPSARVAVGIMRYEQSAPAPPSAQLPSDFIQESFKEAVEERNTLRGMVRILQRERDEFEKQVNAYQRRYGVLP